MKKRLCTVMAIHILKTFSRMTAFLLYLCWIQSNMSQEKCKLVSARKKWEEKQSLAPPNQWKVTDVKTHILIEKDKRKTLTKMKSI